MGIPSIAQIRSESVSDKYEWSMRRYRTTSTVQRNRTVNVTQRRFAVLDCNFNVAHTLEAFRL